jgi:long-chain acyl-CoA synthetase
VFDYIAAEHGQLAAFHCLGKTLSYAEIDDLANRFASFLLHHSGLEPGDHIAIQLPNLLQFPVVVYGAIKAGLIVVNTNPLYTAQEMQHQFQDSAVKAIVILSSFCHTLEQVLPDTAIETVIVTELGDLQNNWRRAVLNFAARYVKKMVPRYHLPSAIPFMQTLAEPAQAIDKTIAGSGDQVALILYTGGTTGIAKGAMLSHNNLIANMMQLRSRCLIVIEDKIEQIAAPLPLYHSYAFLLHCLVMPYAGNLNVLVPNPRDIKGLLATFKRFRFSGFVGINTLYAALLRDSGFTKLDFRALKFCGAGGMPMSSSIAEEWEQLTGLEVIEGYGLTECSPVVAVNIPGKVKRGTVGPVVPETEIRVVDDVGNDVPQGERGELWVRGPQVMLGYWQRVEATAEAINSDGWFKTGDYVEVDDDAYISIVDRKKDMILVSGFNVFPNEVEDWVNRHPKVLESAAISVDNERTGEAIRLFVVPRDKSLTAKEVISYCKTGLTNYKVPRDIVFVDDLPKSTIGKILRRELR